MMPAMSADGSTPARSPRRVLGVAVPGRRVLLAIVLFAAVCVALIAGAPQRRVGDGGEYMAMAWNLSHFRHPALTLDDAALLDQHYASLEPDMRDYRGSTLLLPALESGGRYDMLHFWMYPALATPFVGVANLLDIPDTYGFAALNIGLLTLAFGVLLQRRGAVAAAVLCCSPMWWWLDKPHPEILIGTMILLALLWRHDRPIGGLVAVAVATSQNIGLAPVAAIYAGALVWEHRSTLIDGRRRQFGLIAAFLIAVMHPAYYLVRLGSYDPVPHALDHEIRVPTVNRVLTPVLDPYVGYLVWWPGLLVVTTIGAVVVAWRRQPGVHRLGEWVLICIPALMAFALLVGQAQIREAGSGGTFAMVRYGLWLAPFFVVWLDRSLFRGRILAPVAAALVTGSAVLSWHVARPSEPDVWYTVSPTWVSELINEHAPWAWDPAPQVFLTRQWGQFTPQEPVANDACTKLLAVGGAWPATCAPPSAVPDDCATSAFCYANWNGRGWWFRPLSHIG